MVLSNKKLKQKLRESLSESLFEKTLSNSKISNQTNPETPKSLKQLLDSATQKPSLSKREKRRKTLNLHPPEEENSENKVARVEETEIGKKRKREKKVKSDGVDVGEDLKKEEKEEAKDNPKRKKKKKKHKHKKKGKGEKLDNQSDVVEVGAVVKEAVPQIVEYDSSQANEEDTKKVYAGGIPFYSTEDDIRSYFDHCGTILDIDCMTFPESGKFRGIAMISFKTKEAAKRALALDGSDMGGLFLKIQPYKSTRPTKTTDFSPPVITGYNRVYAGNLSWDITEEDLKNLFSNCKISAIRFGEDKETGEFKGYAHVDFADHPSLTKALELDQTVVCGRPVRIRCAVPAKNVGSTNTGTESTVVAVETETETQTQPQSSMAIQNENSITAVENETVVNNVGGLSLGKLKRRTCYECGEKGHISSDCPSKKGIGAMNVGYAHVDFADHPSLTKALELDQGVVCGRPVRIRSAVPAKNAGSTNTGTESTIVDAETQTQTQPQTSMAIQNENSITAVENETLGNNVVGGGAVSLGKLKRRTCYECGEKGHISSDCPSKKAGDS